MSWRCSGMLLREIKSCSGTRIHWTAESQFLTGTPVLQCEWLSLHLLHCLPSWEPSLTIKLRDSLSGPCDLLTQAQVFCSLCAGADCKAGPRGICGQLLLTRVPLPLCPVCDLGLWAEGPWAALALPQDGIEIVRVRAWRKLERWLQQQRLVPEGNAGSGSQAGHGNWMFS